MRSFYLFILLGLLVSSCSTPQKPATPTVTVSVIPQKFFIDQLAGDWLTVNVMIPVGSSPATYEPTPMQMKELSNSQLYFAIGHIGFEKAWMGKLSSLNTAMKVVNTSENLALVKEEAFGEEHDDGHGHSHSHAGYNPHIWVSPKLVKGQLEVIYKELSKAYPQYADSMKVNFEKFNHKIDSATLILDEKLKDKQGTSFIVYHPVWTYLAHDYGLKQISIEYNGKEANPKKMKEIIDYAHANDIHVIFIQREFNKEQALSIAREIDGDVMQFNPLEYNWFKVIDEFGDAFSRLE